MGSGCTKEVPTEVTPFVEKEVKPPELGITAKPTISVTLSSPNLMAEMVRTSSGRELDRMPSFHLKAPETRDRAVSISKLFEDVSELLFCMESKSGKFTLINDAWKKVQKLQLRLIGVGTIL
jgi:hypothetical protein